jgi:hypothetical protein
VQRSATITSGEHPWTPFAGACGHRNLRIVPCLDALRHGVIDINRANAFYRAMRSIRSPKGRVAATPSRPAGRAQHARAPFGTAFARFPRPHRRSVPQEKLEKKTGDFSTRIRMRAG